MREYALVYNALEAMAIGEYGTGRLRKTASSASREYLRNCPAGVVLLVCSADNRPYLASIHNE